MNIVNHEPIIRVFVNGIQITFPNQFTVLVKNGIGAKCTQRQAPEDSAELFLAKRFGGVGNPDVEVEIYSPKKENITEKFGEHGSLGFVTPVELVNLLYIVSSLRNDVKGVPGTGRGGSKGSVSYN
jgi:hypothetical protein